MMNCNASVLPERAEMGASGFREALCFDSGRNSKRPRDLSLDHCGIFYVQKILKIYFK